MSRAYCVSFENVSITLPQDLIQVKGAAGKILRIKRVKWGVTDTTLVTAQHLETRCQFLPATVTDGSQGGSATPRPFDPGDAAASFTAKINNTTVATSNGTAATLFESGDHAYAGLDNRFETPPIIGPSESFVFGLLSTVTGTVHLSGEVEVEELGG